MTGTGNHIALLIGWGGTASTGTNTISSTSGDITLKGFASSFSNAKSYGLWLTTNRVETVDGDINLRSSAAATVGRELTYAGASVSSTNGSVLVSTGTSSGIATFESSGTIGAGTAVSLGVHRPTFTSLTLNGAGDKIIEPPAAAQSFAASVTTTNLTVSNASSSLRIGKSGNTADITVDRANTIAGDITVFGGAVAVNANQIATGSISMVANTMTLAGSLRTPTGIVTLSPSTAARNIDIVETTRVDGSLSLTATELERISATTLRLTNSGLGDITFATGLDLALTGKVTNLAIRAGDAVVGQNVTIAVANLGVDAGGNISFPGTGGNVSVIALNTGTGSIGFGQSANYAVAAVDGIIPEFGYGVSFSFTTEDRTNTVNRFMAVTFNPPPVIQIRDKFGNNLASSNTSAADYVVSAAMTVISTSTGSMSAEGLTATTSTGPHTFTALRVNGGTGQITLSYTATRADGFKLPDTHTGAV
jgi:hypothetical protein